MSVVLINIKTDKRIELLIPEDYMVPWRKDFPFYFRGIAVWNDKFIILPIVGNRILMLDFMKKEINGLEIKMSESWEEMCYKFNSNYFDSTEIWGESEEFSIREYIKFVRYKS